MKKPKDQPLTAEQVIAKNIADPAFLARERERERQRVAKILEMRAAEAPLVAALRSAGFDVRSIWDLVTTRAKYAEAYPILMEHLQKDYPAEIREGIARALATPDAKMARSLILDEYAKTPDATHESLKVGLAVAIVATTTAANLKEVIALIKQPVHGMSRIMLLDALRKSKSPEAKEVIEELREDPTFKDEIARWRRKRVGSSGS